MKSLKTLALVFVLTGLSALPAHAAATGHFEKTLQVNGAVDMEVTSGSGNITVHQGGAGSVYVTAKLKAGNASWLFGGGNLEERIHRIEQNPPITQQGNTIRIGKLEDRDLAKNISIDYDVTVPPQTKLNTYSGSGDLTISGLQLPLTAKTGSGNVTVEHITADSRVSSGSGDLKINSVKGILYAETGSGNIRANDVAGDASVDTGSGDVQIRQSAGGSVKAQTGSGNIKLQEIKGGLRADAGSGNIQAEGQPTADWHLSA